MIPHARPRRKRVILAALLAAFVASLLVPYPLRRTHGQAEQFTATHTFDPTSGQLTLYLTINDASVMPVLSIGLDHTVATVQSLVQAPPGCTPDPLSGIFFVDCTSPELQLGVAYTFVFQIAPGSSVSGPLTWLTTQIVGNNAFIHSFTSQPAPLPTPTSTPLPTSTPTPIPPTATATPTPSPTSSPTATATPLPPALTIDTIKPLHVGQAVTIRVRVRDKETRRPVTGAEVTVKGRSVGLTRVRHGLSNASGVAVFRKVRLSHTGTLEVSASKSGYASASRRVQVRP